jgi:hypothetical protein
LRMVNIRPVYVGFLHHPPTPAADAAGIFSLPASPPARTRDNS